MKTSKSDIASPKCEMERFLTALRPKLGMEEFSQLTSDKVRVQRMLQVCKMNEITIEKSREVQKSADVAKEFRELGNKQFRNKEFGKAVESYSMSILAAPFQDADQSEEASLGLANRSAVLLHQERFNESIANIDASLRFGYPSEMRHKLFERKSRCLQKLGKIKEAVAAAEEALSLVNSASTGDTERCKLEDSLAKLKLEFNSGMNRSKSVVQKKLDHSDETQQLRKELIGKQNPEYPSACDAMRVESAEESGRYAVASRDIEIGETIVVEKPFVSILSQQVYPTNCLQCFVVVDLPFPCPWCSDVVFCSLECRQRAITGNHKHECSLFRLMWRSGLSVTCFLSLRILTQAQPEEFLQKREVLEKALNGSQEMPRNEYLQLFRLVTHNELRSDEDNFQRTAMACFLLKCLQTTEYFSGIASEAPDTEVFFGQLLLRHLQFLQYNAHEVAQLNIPKEKLLNEEAKSVGIGAALYPTLALFNHSCDPGIIRYNVRDTIVVQAIKPTKAGEMIAENYGPIFTTSTKQERQAHLRGQYQFDCNCRPCADNWPKIEDMSKTVYRLKCSGKQCGAVVEFDLETTDFPIKCKSCCNAVNLLKAMTGIQDAEAIYTKASELFLSIRGTDLSGEKDSNVAESLKLFIESQQKLDTVLHWPYPDYNICQEAMRKCMLSFGNLNQA